MKNAALDMDGDVWGQEESGTWRCLTDPSGKFSTGELIDAYSPVSFAVDPSEEERER